MQIICGQCGTQLTVEPHPDMTFVQCTNCGHEIVLGDSQDDSTADDDFFVGKDETHEGFADQAHRALRQRVLIRCGKCGEKMRLPRRMMGRKIRCKSCSKMLQIPKIEDDGQFDKNVLKTTGIFDEDWNDNVENDADFEMAMRQNLYARKNKSVKLIVIGLVVLVITGFVVYHIFLSSPAPQETSGDDDLPVAGIGANPITSGEGDGISISGTSDKATVTCISKHWSIFAVDGYFPAALGRMYCMLTVQITAGGNPVGFSNYGPDVVLSIGHDIYESLGEQLDDPGNRGPVLSQKGVIRLGAEDSQEVTFVFDVPAEKATGTLHIQGMNEVAVSLIDPGKVSGDIVGGYHEVTPRNIKPLLQDPVMEAIQNTENQRLIVNRGEDGGLSVTILQSGVSGKVFSEGDGIFSVVIRKGGNSLRGKLRLIDDGNLVVFYLRNSPMYQMTYRRDGTKPPSEQFNPLPRSPKFFDESFGQ